MKMVFIDTNIFLDIFLNRGVFTKQSMEVWAACETGKVHGVVSAMTLNNTHYVCSKSHGRQKALEAVRSILSIFKIVALDDKILRLAAANPGNDFEDAIQFYSALEVKASCIVTRDASDFPEGQIPILSPGEFLFTLNP